METEAHTLNLSRAVRDLFTGVADADRPGLANP